MNRRQKIIVSVVGIFIVLLALVGLTYAYFLTQIKGNTNNKSISVTTANLRLVYGGDNGSIIGDGEVIEPGKVFAPKTFTVTNEGDDTEYVVVLDDVFVKYASDSIVTIDGEDVEVNEGDDTAFVSNDFKYTLTCTIESTDEVRNGKKCNEVYDDTLLLQNGVLIGNSIKAGDIHHYSFILEYEETGKNQNADMNKKLSGLINIKDIRSTNPYSDNKDSLSYNIVNNSLLEKNGTELVSGPKSIVGLEISKDPYLIEEREINQWTNENYFGQTWLVSTVETEAAIIEEATKALSGQSSNISNYLTTNCEDAIGKEIVIGENLNNFYYHTITRCEGNTPVYEVNANESILSVTSDDYGTSYYYRGDVEDNYVTFANMCWRIVRINGDGSVRLILEDQNQVCSENMDGNWDYKNIHYGYTTNTDNLINIDFLKDTSSTSFASSLKDFQVNKLNGYLDDLDKGKWCYANEVYGDKDGNVLLNEASLNSYLSSYTNSYFEPYTRLYNGVENVSPSLKCSGEILDKYNDNTDMYVGGITADEMVFAGAKLFADSNSEFYMVNDYIKESQRGFLTMTPAMYTCENSKCTGKIIDFRYCKASDGGGYCTEKLEGNLSQMPSNWINHYVYSRPVINLNNNTNINSGEGTIANPYVIN